METIRLKLIYDGKGPAIWTPAPGAFGLQDKAETLQVGTPGKAGAVVFDFALQVKSIAADQVVLVGDFAHGKPAERFLYLGWRNAHGAFAQRLKLPLHMITPAQAREATTTGANIGGTRPVTWALA